MLSVVATIDSQSLGFVMIDVGDEGLSARQGRPFFDSDCGDTFFPAFNLGVLASKCVKYLGRFELVFIMLLNVLYCSGCHAGLSLRRCNQNRLTPKFPK